MDLDFNHIFTPASKRFQVSGVRLALTGLIGQFDRAGNFIKISLDFMKFHKKCQDKGTRKLNPDT
jgi:hypothetical protein